MFIGEALCLIAFCIKRARDKRNEEGVSAGLLSKGKVRVGWAERS